MNDSPLPMLEFDTDHFLARQRSDMVRECLASTWDVANGWETLGRDERWRFRTWLLGKVAIGDWMTGSMDVHRDAARVRRDAVDHYAVILVRRGDWRGEFDGTMVAAATGDLVVLDLARPSVVHASVTNAQTAIVVGRDVIDALVPMGSIRHGQILRGAAAELFRNHVTSLRQALSVIGMHHADLIDRATCDLLAACLAPSAETTARAVGPIGHARREAVEFQAEALLGIRGLSPDMLAKAAGLSRTALYRLLEPEGGVEAFIVRRRLARALALLGTADSDRSISDIAETCGFASDAHFSRAFRRAYGATPGDVRGRVAEAAGGEPPGRAMHRWIAQLEATDPPPRGKASAPA